MADNSKINEPDLPIEENSSTAGYGEGDIKTLTSLEHIRQRPGMYVGRMGDGTHQDDAIYVMLKEVIDNSVDEYMMGFGKRIDITLNDTTITVRDYGRGIPLGKVVDCVSKMNTGGKYNSGGYYGTIGLNGVGTKAVNALSGNFLVRSVRDGKFKEAEFESGKLIREKDGKTDDRNGTLIRFSPDPKLFPKITIKQEFVEHRLWMYAYLNSGLSLYFNNQRYYSKNGLRDLTENRVQGENLYDIIHYKDKTLEFALTHIADFGETYFSFVNGQYTKDGGTHESAFKEALLRAVNEFSGKEFDAKDFRGGIVGSIAIKLQEPVFESQTKSKLGSTDVKSWIVPTVKKAVVDYLYRHTEEAERLLEKIKKNEDVRKEIQAVKKKGKEFEKKLTVRNSKLRDCKYHFGDRSGKGDETMIFLTEGDSAGGSMVQSRDPNTQAVFALRGKPFNCFGKKIETVYTVEELFCIMRTLDIEEDIENLRYNKVVIATDADVDGLHIRNLLITFFLSYFERLVQTGHLYILETPLFRVRPKGKKDAIKATRKGSKKKDAKAAEPELKPNERTYYCYSEEERDEKAAVVGKNAEITRFKGLGEISPDEFRQFIDENIRLEQVMIDQTKGIQEMLRFYMGDNTPERWEFIQNNLV
ncbi:MAG: type IIA DNA topoisomerase subunit B [Lentisphaeria bacterium]|nr:type IIA DNA topoisomerase subunit B [Lentisphaeria bacterium]